MTTGILTVTKEGSGEEWANTYGINMGGDAGPLTLADLEALIATNPSAGFTEDTTNTTGSSYGGATSIIAAILGFERLIHYHTVRITRLNVSDATTPGEPTGPFWSAAVSLPGVRDATAFVDDDAIAPLSICLLVNRNTNVLGVRPGRLYYRSALLDAQVRPGSRVGVSWKDISAQNTVTEYVNDSFAGALLNEWVSTPGFPLPDQFLSIPRYTTDDDPGGVVVSSTAVSTFSVNKPVSRQLTRGRRRAAAPVV